MLASEPTHCTRVQNASQYETSMSMILSFACVWGHRHFLPRGHIPYLPKSQQQYARMRSISGSGIICSESQARRGMTVGTRPTVSGPSSGQRQRVSLLSALLGSQRLPSPLMLRRTVKPSSASPSTSLRSAPKASWAALMMVAECTSTAGCLSADQLGTKTGADASRDVATGLPKARAWLGGCSSSISIPMSSAPRRLPSSGSMSTTHVSSSGALKAVDGLSKRLLDQFSSADDSEACPLGSESVSDSVCSRPAMSFTFRDRAAC
mmetsp:Transcript_72564/g.137195  ORF Transcript_72564/g.137195 Transcript_72564/m.137195 type:complete len:265 (+) Transcript_72564:70-864(+)